RMGGANAAPYNWTQISVQLDNSTSPFALNIDGTANRLITAICKIDGGQPPDVCSQSFAQVVSYAKNSPSGGPQLLISDLVQRGASASYAFSMFETNHLFARV